MIFSMKVYCTARLSKVRVNNVAREQLKAKYGGKCYNTVTLTKE